MWHTHNALSAVVTTAICNGKNCLSGKKKECFWGILSRHYRKCWVLPRATCPKGYHGPVLKAHGYRRLRQPAFDCTASVRCVRACVSVLLECARPLLYRSKYRHEIQAMNLSRKTSRSPRHKELNARDITPGERRINGWNQDTRTSFS